MWLKFTILLILFSYIHHTSQQDPEIEQLLVANATTIFKFDEINYKSTPITQLPIDDKVKVLDYSYNDRLLFWLNELDYSINVHNIDTGQKINLLKDQPSSSESFAIDWITKKIYWIVNEPYRIEVSDFNGSNNSLILLLNNQTPKSIVLAPLNGLLFWNDNLNEAISRVSMDGDESTIKQIISHTRTDSLSIDHKLKKIYWNDILSRRIKSADFDGQHLREIQSTYTPSITFYNSNLYYSDQTRKKIYSINTIGKKVRELTKFTDSSPQLNYFSHKNQPDNPSSQCLVNNGGCSNLCLLSSESPYFSCACPTGLPLSSDNRTCKTFPDQYLLIAFANQIDYISLETKDFLAKNTQIKNRKIISAVDFDPIEQRIYWTEKNQVKSAYLNGSDEKLITESDLEYERLRIDTINRNLYLVKNSIAINTEKAKNPLSRSSNFSIEVVSIDKRFKKSLIEDYIDSPRGIAVDSENQFFYWSDWGKKPKIERVSFDLKVREQIITTDIAWPNAIVIDQQLKRLYWCDAKLNKIEFSELDGSNRTILLKLKAQFLDLILLGDYIYWIDRMKDQVGRVHKLNGKYEIVSNRHQKLTKVMGLTAASKSAFSYKNQKKKDCSQLSLSSDLCDCSNGFILQDDLITCSLGTNSCALNNGDCDQNCDQIIGNYRKCSCYEGLILDPNQKTCHLRNDVLPKPNCEQSPCSHKCYLIEDKIHCSCPTEMYLGFDGKTCINQIVSKYDSHQQATTNRIIENDALSTSTIIIVSILIVCSVFVSVPVFRCVIMNKKVKKLKNSKEHILQNNNVDPRKIDFGYSLSNVENSIICDRGLGVGASALGEDRSLLDPPPSPDNMSSVSKQCYRPRKFDSDEMRFTPYNLTRFRDLNEFDASIDQLDNLSNVDSMTNLNSSRIFVPPPTPLNNFEDYYHQLNYNDKQAYNSRKKINPTNDPTDLTMKNEFMQRDFSNYDNCNSSLNTSIYTYHHTLNPPNSPSSSIDNLQNFSTNKFDI